MPGHLSLFSEQTVSLKKKTDNVLSGWAVIDLSRGKKMRKVILLLSMLYILIVISPLAATPPSGGEGLFYIQSARIIPKGFLEWYNGIHYYGKIANFEGHRKPYTLWNVQGITSFNYGLSSRFELGISPIIYQDTNKGEEEAANFPDDLLVSIKYGSIRKLESHFIFGAQLQTRIPTGKYHNIIYEPYASGRLEVGINALFSYYRNVAFLDEGWSLHGNIGYLNHYDVGKELTENPDDPTPQSMSSEILLGLGFLYPAGAFNFSAEVNGRYFLTRPPETAYSREHMTYLTAGVYYKLYRWMTIEMAFDISLQKEEDLSVYSPATGLPNPPSEDFPNYPTWRGLIGLKFNILPYLFSSSEDILLKQRTRDRRAILEKLMNEQKETEDAESELSKIRSERKRVEEELERLRQLMEEEKKKKEKDE